nr:reverse transcriptase domain-containing protein [Tanacetum cinerariifolium]
MKHDAIWVIVDRLMKSAHFILIQENMPVQKLAKIYVNEIMASHEVPVSIVSDRDGRFTSNFWQEFQEELGTRLHMSMSRPNGNLIYNSIMNGPYVSRMIPEPGDADREVLVNETFHEQTNNELTEKELKQQMMKGFEIGIQEKKDKIQLQAEEFDLMAAAADLDEIEEVNANCILIANLQQTSTSGTESDKALVYDLDGSAEVQLHVNCYNDEIFNMFTQEEQYIELLEPILELHHVQQIDSNVNSGAFGMEQEGEQ